MTIEEEAKVAWRKYSEVEETDPWEKLAFVEGYKEGRLRERHLIIEHLRTVYAQNRNAQDIATLIEQAPHVTP